jgi:tetraacyldisaccharide 4'-kinase
MKIFKPKFWNKKNSLISFILLPLTIFIQILISVQKRMTIIKKISIPVICVGNIYLGGTGKTPLSIEIATVLKKFNKKTAIIKKSYVEHSDELGLIESRGVALFKNLSRIKAISSAIENNFNCVVLDDGLQDFSINKNISIVCFNEKQLWGNGMTFPSGPLREPLSSLKRCQIVVINGSKNFEFERKIQNISKDISIYYSKYLPINLEDFRNQNLLAFAGIGNPKNFFDLLEDNNLKLIKKISFPDHYNYSLEELNKMIDYSFKNNLKLITTEKDFFRIKHFQLIQIKYLKLKLEILNKDSFENEINKYL